MPFVPILRAFRVPNGAKSPENHFKIPLFDKIVYFSCESDKISFLC